MRFLPENKKGKLEILYIFEKKKFESSLIQSLMAEVYSWVAGFVEKKSYYKALKSKQYLVRIQVHENKNVFSSERISPHCLQRFLRVGNSSYE